MNFDIINVNFVFYESALLLDFRNAFQRVTGAALSLKEFSLRLRFYL